MENDDLEQATDLEREDLDPERFAAALAVQHIQKLIMYGGSVFGRTGDEDGLLPRHFERFIPHAFTNAQKTGRFVHYWQRLQQILPRLKIAWEKGHVLFQEHLTRAMTNQEEMEYLSTIDFAVDFYAYISAKDTYPDNSVMQAWAVNGYMVAWREHFLNEKDNSF